MIITCHREKLINAITYFANNTKYCGKTKLLKLLYFLDFRHFKQTGKSVTGLDYYAWDMGPVPKDLYNELDDMVESTHLANEPWDRTLKEKGMFAKIDYMLSIDNIDNSLPANEARERQAEISEMHKIFGRVY